MLDRIKGGKKSMGPWIIQFMIFLGFYLHVEFRGSGNRYEKVIRAMHILLWYFGANNGKTLRER